MRKRRYETPEIEIDVSEEETCITLESCGTTFEEGDGTGDESDVGEIEW